MADGRRWIHFQDLLIPHADLDRFPTIQATCVDADLSVGKEPVHG